MKIAWIIWNDITPGRENASSRIRARWVQKYMPDSIISNDFEEIKKCDVIIFQKRFTTQDVEWAKVLKVMNKTIIFDITDPEWNYEYQHYDYNRQKPLEEIIELADYITVPTEFLAGDFSNYFPHKKVKVINDRVDLELYPKVKTHKKHKRSFIVFWHGCHSNTDVIYVAKGAIERLAQEYSIKLVCCYGPTMDNRISQFQNVELEQIAWSQEKCTELMLKADVSVNPRWGDLRAYKSNNKTIAALACGTPCADRDFYKQLKGWFDSVEERNSIGISGRHLVENFYDSKISVKEYLNLIKEITNPPLKYRGKPNSIVVVSCITAGTDNVVEDQNTEGADFVMFTDNPNIISKTWHIETLKPDLLIDPRRQSRMMKWLLHKFFADYEYSLWLDGNVRVLTPVGKLINMFLRYQNIAVFKHKDRNCVYKEADDCINKQLDDPALIKRQMDRYRAEGFPSDNGLSELPAILRRHTPEIERFNEAVWSEYSTQSRRDQLCFDYIAWKLRMQISRFPGKVTRKDLNIHFEKVSHNKENRRV